MVAGCHMAGGRARVVGITGAPGSGKSTLVDRLVAGSREQRELVAVVAVDPSSPFTGGAILGDRVRMQAHVSDPGVYVRSMSNRGHLGGLADATAKVVVLLDAAGFDAVYVETVGVGQSEVEVVELADTVAVVVTPGMGDDIQAAKAGLLEIGDVYVVNKSDLAGADEVVRHLMSMLALAAQPRWHAPVVACSAASGEGVVAVVDALDAHRRHLEIEGRLADRRRRQAGRAVRAALLTRLERIVDESVAAETVDAVVAREIDPWSAAEQLAATGRADGPDASL